MLIPIIALASLLSAPPSTPPDRVRVVASLTTYAAIAREITGDRGDVTSIGSGYENPHYVEPKPSFVPALAAANLFVTTGLDLELWVPALLDKASNPNVTEGGPGYVAVYTGIKLLDVPTSFSRSEGDVHAFGNPHIWTAPLNAIQIARNILTGLKRVAPADAQYFTTREAAFEDHLYRALYGDTLVQLIGGPSLAALDAQGRLLDFLRTKQYRGSPLASRLGGWVKEAMVFRGKRIVCYHKEWDYFSQEFDIPCIDYIEPKPGIPPTPSHVQEVIQEMQQQKIQVLFSTNYYDRNQVQEVASRTGATAVIVPGNVQGAPDVNTYFDLVNVWVRSLAAAYTGAAGAAP